MGKASKKEYGIYLLGIYIFLFSMFFLAQSKYPGGYSFITDMISAQGNPTKNPDGCFYFIIGAGIIGFLLIPYFLFLYCNLIPTTKLVSVLSIIFGIIGSIGFSFVGFLPANLGPPHAIAGRIAFGGFYISAFLMLIVLIRKIQLKDSWPTLKGLLFVYSIFFILFFLARMIPGAAGEWIHFLNIFLWITNLYILVQEKELKNKL